jgi:ParB-like chromosome segregation protein Spo0J
MNVVQVPVATLHQHPDNPNNGDVDAIAESISVNGFYQPIVVQTSTRYILAGNTRYAAAIKLGLTEVPVVFAEVDRKAATRILLADNRTSQLAWMDEPQLAGLLESVYETELGLSGTGYDYGDFSSLIDLINDPVAPDEVELNEETPDQTVVSEREREKPGRHLKYTMVPVVDEDGHCRGLSVRKSDERSISLLDYNMIRKALGQDPLSQEEADTFNVPHWQKD